MAFRLREITIQLMPAGNPGGGGQPCVLGSGAQPHPCEPPSCGATGRQPPAPPKPGGGKKPGPVKKRWLAVLRSQLRDALAAPAR